MSQVIKMLTYSRSLHYDTGSSAMTLNLCEKVSFLLSEELKVFLF